MGAPVRQTKRKVAPIDSGRNPGEHNDHQHDHQSALRPRRR
jgi:hypothetical protein